MSVYLVSEIVVNNPKGYQEYKRLAPPTMANYRGKYITLGLKG
tara:strand:+ start:86 stop:214 length:129 start_codon:yes stop_codon:yes gene_type:complete